MNAPKITSTPKATRAATKRQYMNYRSGFGKVTVAQIFNNFYDSLLLAIALIIDNNRLRNVYVVYIIYALIR